MTKNTIYIASDHRGFSLKQVFIAWLGKQGYQVQDFGPSNTDRVNASDYAIKLAEAMRKDPEGRGVLICGTGQAMAMTANRYRHLRAALCTNPYVVRMTREHNDANVLVLGSEVVGEGLAIDCLDVFLTTEFLGGRYAERCQMLSDLGGL